eukprot:TRINITY_DN115366_c0_g1_i2.p1 TRINITY_DN115366_c0_g1~~TRINITY_DN115366_c0_g1_i2.p1  ORF type:complete len:215 (+),score=46.91 TRINITY_DN115366_c0_g1_i2:46-690(+)
MGGHCTSQFCPDDAEEDEVSPVKADDQLEELVSKLFELHDLRQDGKLDQRELVKLNEKIAKLHYGKKKFDKEEIKTRYETLFRDKLDASGRPVPFKVFRKYMLSLLNEMDTDRNSQEMILEQFIAEAQSARAAFHSPTLNTLSDAEFLSKMSLPDFFTSQQNLVSGPLGAPSPYAQFQQPQPGTMPVLRNSNGAAGVVMTGPLVSYPQMQYTGH